VTFGDVIFAVILWVLAPFDLRFGLKTKHLVLVKNERYFETRQYAGVQLPYLDAVKTTFIGDRKTAFLEFKKGNLDYFFGLESCVYQRIAHP
jgi:oligopeptide transport system substrate-binding protein